MKAPPRPLCTGKLIGPCVNLRSAKGDRLEKYYFPFLGLCQNAAQKVSAMHSVTFGKHLDLKRNISENMGFSH